MNKEVFHERRRCIVANCVVFTLFRHPVLCQLYS